MLVAELFRAVTWVDFTAAEKPAALAAAADSMDLDDKPQGGWRDVSWDSMGS